MPSKTFEEFKKENPHLEQFWPYLDILNKESERGKVLISTGFLEQQLKEILSAFMLDNAQARDLVAGHNAPLGSFSSRITACFVLGLITEKEHNDLHLIRRIRNDYAHDIHTTFKTASVADRCKQLQHKAPDYIPPNKGAVKVDAAGQFTTAAVAIIMNLINRAHYVSKARCKTVAWPY